MIVFILGVNLFWQKKNPQSRVKDVVGNEFGIVQPQFYRKLLQ